MMRNEDLKKGMIIKDRNFISIIIEQSEEGWWSYISFSRLHGTLKFHPGDSAPFRLAKKI
jgi:hypothetical protein